MSEFELCPPSRCTSKLPDELEKDFLVGEEKLDGSRYVFYIGCDPYGRNKNNALLSRRVSVVDQKHVDRTRNCPHFTDKIYEGLEGTVLDGEIQAADFLATNSIMNSAPSLAIQKQKELGLLNYHVFDVMFFRGNDVRTRPLSERRKILIEVIKRMNNPNVKPIEQVQGDLQALFNRIVSKGGEGIIVKDTRKAYGVGWSKMKKSYDVSCVISGWKGGDGKYATTVGSIALSVWHEGKLTEIGYASGFDDKLRLAMAKDFEKYKGKVVDIFTQEIQDSKRSKENPVGSMVTGTCEPIFFNKSLEEYRTIAITIMPVVGDSPCDQSEKF